MIVDLLSKDDFLEGLRTLMQSMSILKIYHAVKLGPNSLNVLVVPDDRDSLAAEIQRSDSWLPMAYEADIVITESGTLIKTPQGF